MAAPRIVSYGFIDLLSKKSDEQFIIKLIKYLFGNDLFLSQLRAIVPSTPSVTSGIIITKTGSYILAAEAINGTLLIDSTGAATVIIPSNLNIADNSLFRIVWQGAGAVAITAASGVTLHSRGDNYIINARYGVAHIVKTGTNTYILYGDLLGGIITNDEGFGLVDDNNQFIVP